MKALYIAFQPLVDCSGISKKIYAQYEALKKCGLEIKICNQKIVNGYLCYTIDGEKIIDKLGSGMKAHLGLYYRYNGIQQYILDNNIKFVYIRYIHIANPLFLLFLRRLHNNGIKIFLEIPTYPYDGEVKNGSCIKRFQMFIERHSRRFFHYYVDRIVTFSRDESIFRIPTVRISNGLDMDQVPCKKQVSHQGFRLICVAMFKEWHGLDRLIEGLRHYYRDTPVGKEVYLTVVGDGDSYFQTCRELVNSYSLTKYVSFVGVKSGAELDELFDLSDLAVGCLACHRKNIYEVLSLKNVEYAARGIPFVYSENNRDFDQREYVYRVAPDESPINIESLIRFVDEFSISSESIRASVESDLSWYGQMQKVCSAIN